MNELADRLTETLITAHHANMSNLGSALHRKSLVRGIMTDVHDWGWEPCPHSSGTTQYPRHACGECWAELVRV